MGWRKTGCGWRTLGNGGPLPYVVIILTKVLQKATPLKLTQMRLRLWDPQDPFTDVDLQIYSPQIYKPLRRLYLHCELTL